MIRPATPQDIPALYLIHRAAYRDLVTKVWGPWNEDFQSANFRDHFDCAIRSVISHDNQTIGYIDIIRRPDHLYLVELVIAPKFQRRGIGGGLLQNLLAESRQTSLPLKLQVLKINPARIWYKSLGFQITGQTETHFMMQFNPAAGIRPAATSDVPALLALIRELADYEKLSHACIATESLLAQHLFGPDRAAEAILTEIPDAAGKKSIIAYALYFKTFSTFLARPGLYLEDLYVQPQHRNQGHGKALLKYLAQLAVARNYGRLEWTCLDWNTPSLAFYKSLGAQALKEWQLHRLTGDALQKFADK